MEDANNGNELTSFDNICSILSQLWTDYKQDKELKDFIEYNDIGLPLAFLIDSDLVEPSDLARGYVVETWQIFLSALGLEDDIEWKSLDQIFKYSEGRNRD